MIQSPSKYLVVIFSTLLLLSSTIQAQKGKTEVSSAAGEDPVFRMHAVKKNETLFSISKKYHITETDLIKLNPGLSATNLKKGRKIKVPIVTSEIRKEDRERTKMLKHAILYKVQKKETLTSIAKKTNTDVKTLMTWNELKKPDVKEGQQLIVGFKNPKYAPKTAGEKEYPETVKKPNTSATSINSVPVVQNGAGGWIKNADDDGHYYALHATAPVGSFIEVKNPMNNKTITVKVIGKLPATAENERVIIKLSQSAAKALNILDEKFRVELSYMAKQ